MARLSHLVLACVICSGLASGSAPADVSIDVRSLASAVDSHYDHINSLQADFTEIYSGSGIERTESGILWLRKAGVKNPGKMRWEYRSPREKLFVSNGKIAWFYVPGDQQARKTPVRKLDDLRSPLAFMLGKTKLEKELEGLSVAVDVPPLSPGDVVLRGIPKGWTDQISEILLEVTPEHEIARIIIHGVDGAVTEYRFSQQKENVPIADGEFQFAPPPGTETVEGNLAP